MVDDSSRHLLLLMLVTVTRSRNHARQQSGTLSSGRLLLEKEPLKPEMVKHCGLLPCEAG
jgi:hypothetical protein